MLTFSTLQKLLHIPEVAFLWDFPSHEKKSQSHGKKITWDFLKKSGIKIPKKSQTWKNVQKWKKKLKNQRKIKNHRKNHYSRCSLVLLFQKTFLRPEFFKKFYLNLSLNPCTRPWDVFSGIFSVLNCFHFFLQLVPFSL